MASVPTGMIQLIDDVTSANSAPSAATDGVAIPARWGDIHFLLRSTAGSGTMTVTVRLWVYRASALEDGSGDEVGWYPLGTNSTGADRGILNEGNAIPEVTSNKLEHTERIVGLNAYDRAYCEVTAIGGTATAVSAWLVKARGGIDG